MVWRLDYFRFRIPMLFHVQIGDGFSVVYWLPISSHMKVFGYIYKVILDPKIWCIKTYSPKAILLYGIPISFIWYDSNFNTAMIPKRHITYHDWTRRSWLWGEPGPHFFQRNYVKRSRNALKMGGISDAWPNPAGYGSGSRSRVKLFERQLHWSWCARIGNPPMSVYQILTHTHVVSQKYKKISDQRNEKKKKKKKNHNNNNNKDNNNNNNNHNNNNNYYVSMLSIIIVKVIYKNKDDNRIIVW